MFRKSDNSSSTAIISPRLQTSLESEALREGLLSWNDYNLREIYEIPPAFGQRGFDPKILSYLCLFPAVIATRSDFDLDKMALTSGLDVQTIEPRGVREYNLCNDQKIMEVSDFRTLIKMCHDEIQELCAVQERELAAIIEDQIYVSPGSQGNLSGLENDQLKHFTRRSLLPAIRLMGSHWYKDGDHSATPFQGLGLEELLIHEANIPSSVIGDPYFQAWLDKLDDFYVRLVAAAFYSKLNADKMSTGRWWDRSHAPLGNRPEAALEACQVLIQFKEELRVVPAPRTIREAIDLGRTKEMERLRQLIERWLDVVSEHDMQLETLVRADIAQASAELRRLKQYKEFQESPIVFGARLVAGQIPVISNVVTIVESVGWIYERWASKRNCWVAIK